MHDFDQRIVLRAGACHPIDVRPVAQAQVGGEMGGRIACGGCQAAVEQFRDLRFTDLPERRQAGRAEQQQRTAQGRFRMIGQRRPRQLQHRRAMPLFQHPAQPPRLIGLRARPPHPSGKLPPRRSEFRSAAVMESLQKPEDHFVRVGG
jgi:hypothetical protein